MENNRFDVKFLKSYLLKIVKNIFLLTGVVNLFTFLISLYSYYVLNQMFKMRDIEVVILPTIGILAIYIFHYSVAAKRDIIVFSASKLIDYVMRDYIVYICVLSNSSSSSNVPGRRFLQDLNTVKSFISSKSFATILEIPWSIFFIIGISFISFKISVVCLIGLFFLFLIVLYQYLSSYNEGKIVKSNILQITQSFERFLGNYDIIRGMFLYENVIKFFSNRDIAGDDSMKKRYSKDSVSSYVFKLGKSVIQIIVLISSASLYMNHEITLAGFIVISGLVAKAFSVFDNVGVAINSFIKFYFAYKKLSISTSEVDSFIEYEKKEIANNIEQIGSISLVNVSYLYVKNNIYGVKNINLNIDKSSIVCIAGDNSSGKTTLLKVMSGILRPSSGLVEFGVASKKYFGYFAQDSKLFPVSIRDNISGLSSEDVSEQVIKIAKIFNIHNDIMRLRDGYDTLIFDDSQFSYTFKRKILLAAALFGSPKVLILDDSFMLFDDTYIDICINVFVALKNTGTSTIIASNNKKLQDISDKTIVLHNGEIRSILTKTP